MSNASAQELREREGEKYGGSAEGIRSHYDVSNSFWPLVLGRTMAYSCALFLRPDELLDVAQARKINWHIAAAGADRAGSVLDVGCGWGAALRPLSQLGVAERLTGLTLSDAQLSHLRDAHLPRVDVRLENWAEHRPNAKYDSIISIGAFEHFAKSQESSAEKIAVYRDFFERCYEWLEPGGLMSLQTIAYGNMRPEEAHAFLNEVIFPDSELPYLHEIVAAADGLFEVVAVRNDRFHYALTMEAWGRNLARNKEEATRYVGEAKVEDMLRFFKMAAMGFRMGKQNLLRFALRPISSSWSVVGRHQWADVAGAPSEGRIVN